MPELRIDPICGRRVYVAEERAGRPSDFAAGPQTTAAVANHREREANCPFCRGNEAATPIQSAVELDANGQWQVRVVPNKFPAVAMDAGGGRLDAMPAVGAHEVIIESPRHLVDLTELERSELATVIRVYRDRLRHWAVEPLLKYGLVFKNSGYAAGASLEHLHSQLLALPYVPDAVQAELDGARRHFVTHGRCAFCDLIRSELAAGERVVSRGDNYVAFCAYAGRQPYETWILPQTHAPHFGDLTDAGADKLAAILQDILRRLHTHGGQAAYNLILHTSPWGDSDRDDYHWHWELIPRTTNLAGLEMGAGAYINPVSPERAAANLRNATAASPVSNER